MLSTAIVTQSFSSIDYLYRILTDNSTQNTGMMTTKVSLILKLKDSLTFKRCCKSCDFF